MGNLLGQLPGDLPWTGSDCSGQTIMLQPGIAAVTCGATTEAPVSDRFTFGLMDINGAVPGSGRLDVTNSVDMYHHPSWYIDTIGNIFGVAINPNTGDYFATASSNYSNLFFGFDAILRYGDLAGGTASGNNDFAAGGAVYKMDAVTGQATVFALLPQQSSTIVYRDCDFDEMVIRTNSGLGLGNIAYDETYNQYFVTNIEDGRIYRLDATGTILDSYDPFAEDNGNAGISSLNELVYGIAREPGSDRLFFGTVRQAPTSGTNLIAVYSIDLTMTGSFPGTLDNSNNINGSIDNYLNATETLHFRVPTSNPNSNVIESVSDLSFAPNGDLLLGKRTGCENSFHSSYNHYGETWILTLNGGSNLYDSGTWYNLTFESLGNSYGGVGWYDMGGGSIDYIASAGDILNEAPGPHGLAVFNSPPLGNPVTPLGAISYGPVSDPKGIGGDVEVYSACLEICPPEICLPVKVEKKPRQN